MSLKQILRNWDDELGVYISSYPNDHWGQRKRLAHLELPAIFIGLKDLYPRDDRGNMVSASPLYWRAYYQHLNWGTEGGDSPDYELKSWNLEELKHNKEHGLLVLAPEDLIKMLYDSKFKDDTERSEWILSADGYRENFIANTEDILVSSLRSGDRSMVTWLAIESDIFHHWRNYKTVELAMRPTDIVLHWRNPAIVQNCDIDPLKWFIWDQNIDCRDAETESNRWLTKIGIRDWRENYFPYLREVKELQNAYGLENWREAYDVKHQHRMP